MNRHTNLAQSVGSSLKGAKHGFTGRNFRLLVCFGLAALALALYLPLTATERYIVIILIAIVLAGELFNSAIEELADVVTLDHHEGIARTKELCAGAMLILVPAAAVIGACIFWPYLF